MKDPRQLSAAWLAPLAIAASLGWTTIAGATPDTDVAARSALTPGLKVSRLGGEAASASGEAIEGVYAVANGSDLDIQVRLGPLTTPRGAIPTTWRRLDDGKSLVGAVTVPARGSLLLVLEARAPKPGLYFAAVAQLDAAGQPRGMSQTIVIDRLSATPGAGVLIAPTAPTAVGAPSGQVRLPFRIHNPNTQPLSLERPFISDLLFTADGEPTQLPLPATVSEVDCGDRPAGGAKPINLAPGQTCTATITVPIRHAGAYAVGITLNGAESGSASTTLTVHARNAWFWAALLATLGAGAGTLISWWRTAGRARVIALEDIAGQLSEAKRQQDRAARLQLAPYVDPLLAALKVLEDAVETGRQPAPGGRLDDLRERGRLVAEWLGHEEAAARIQQPSAELTAALTQARDQISDLRTPAAVVGATLSMLRGRLSAARTPAAGVLGLGRVTAGFQLPGGAAVKRLVQRRWAGDMITTIAVGLVIAGGAVSVIWMADPTWGGVGDMLTLFLSTLGVQAGGSALTLRQGAAGG